MGKPKPRKRRERRTGLSPYAKKQKTPYRYEKGEAPPSLEQPHMRRGKIHAGVHSKEY